MGGTTARLAAAAVAACALLSPGSPAAAASLDAAPVVDGISGSGEAIASPATHEVVTVVRDTANTPPPVGRETPGQGRDQAAAPPVAPVQAGPRTMHGAKTQRAAALIARRSLSIRGDVHSESNRSSPPHGRKAMPPARSGKERAGRARTLHRPAAAAPRTARAPLPRHGVAGAARAFEAPAATVFTAFLVAALGAFLPFRLLPLRVPPPRIRRPAFASPIEPPG